jgi:hypothetical protein
MAEQLGQQQTNQGLALHQSQQRNLQWELIHALQSGLKGYKLMRSF